jgi:anti-sigma factor (TIGR02949 family)
MQKPGGTLPMSKPQNNTEKYNCADIEKLAQQFLDDQLNDEEQKRFEEHLDYCLPCDKKIHFEVKLKEIVRLKGKDDVPSDFLESKIKSILNDSH